jgi:NitT/TauT family transport system substrate-binding protein/putative hydroxymethylpyrimidine transport system substrate-binding protein
VPARLVALLACLALLAAGCGADEEEPAAAPPAARVLLDFAPNAVHAGVYAAAARAEEARLQVQVPSSSTDAVRLLLAGRVDLAVLDIHDLALARQEGRDLVGVMALVQRPLASVLARPGIRTPRELEGERVGVTGLPSDVAVLRTIVRGAGGDPARVREVEIGFNAVPSLLGGRVAAATAFWNVEGLALREERPSARVFRVDDYGAPAYPELVVTTSRRTLRERPDLVRRAVAELMAGQRAVLADPAAGVEALLTGARGLERRAVEAQLRAVLPALRPAGVLDAARLRAWSRWEAEVGITGRPPDVARAFDGRFVR